NSKDCAHGEDSLFLMGEIRTKGQLQQEMADEFAWRKRELHNLKSLVHGNEKTPARDMCIRAAVTLLYAHWEGFIKRIAECYLEFVARQQLRNEELPANFIAMAILRLVAVASPTSKIQPCLDIVDFFRSQAAAECNLKWRKGVITKSNLK